MVETVLQCNVSILRSLFLNFQKVDKGDSTRHKSRKVWRYNIRVQATSTVLRRIETTAQKNGAHLY